MSNLYDLMARLQAIEEGAKKSEIPAAQRKEKGGDWKVNQQDLDREEHEGKISHPKELAKNSGRDVKEDVAVDECGGGAIQVLGGPQGQQDNVTMNVTMNGTGAGGISDLMKILRNIEDRVDGDDGKDDVSDLGDRDDALFGEPGEESTQPGQTMDGDMVEKFANSKHGAAGPVQFGIGDITFTGDDLASTGGTSPAARAPGTNPMRPVHEGLVTRLSQMYNEVKSR